MLSASLNKNISFPFHITVNKNVLSVSLNKHFLQVCVIVAASSDAMATMDKWLSKLESSNWLTHVKDILTCACVVAQCIDKEGENDFKLFRYFRSN